MRICIDAGHGGKDPGALGKYSKEKDINLTIAKKLKEKLERSGIEIVMTRTDDVYIDLKQRCDTANKNNCDFFISIHCNSFGNSEASGSETYYYKGSDLGKKLALAIQNSVVGYAKTKDRGVKTADFYVLKYTKMVAALLETAFISNDKEEAMLRNSDWQDGLAKSLAIAICNMLGISPNVEEILYKVFHGDVQSGVYRSKDDAFRVAEELLAEISCGTVKVVSSDGKVIMEKVKEAEQAGPLPEADLHFIADFRRASVQQMESFVHKINPDALYVAQKYIDIGMEEGIRGDIAFAQAIKETNYFRFTGEVKKEQNNFAGLKSADGTSFASFATVDDGIRAHIQHLKAYANTEPIKTQLKDYRFNLIKRGSAPYWENLNGKWAVPGAGYGESIINIWRRILDEKVVQQYVSEKSTDVEKSGKSAEDKKNIEEFENIIKVLSEIVDKMKAMQKG